MSKRSPLSPVVDQLVSDMHPTETVDRHGTVRNCNWRVSDGVGLPSQAAHDGDGDGFLGLSRLRGVRCRRGAHAQIFIMVKAALTFGGS